MNSEKKITNFEKLKELKDYESYNDGFILSLSESIEKIKIEHLQPYEYLSKAN